MLGHNFTLESHYTEVLKNLKSFWFIPGELDAQMLSLLQSTFSAVPISADIVEGSTQLVDNFKGIDNIQTKRLFSFFNGSFSTI